MKSQNIGVEQNCAPLPGSFTALADRIRRRDVTVGIIGLGYVGLPLARAFSEAHVRVLGFDIDATKVSRLNSGESYLQQLPSATIAEMRGQGFEATDRFDRLANVDVVLVCVPTPLTLTREPDLTYVVKSMEAVSAQLRASQLIVLDSTT